MPWKTAPKACGLRALWLCVVFRGALLSATNVVQLTAAEGASSFDGSVANVVEEIIDQLGTVPGSAAVKQYNASGAARLEDAVGGRSEAELSQERIANVQKALGGLTERQAQSLLELLQEYVDTNREILERLDSLETKHRDELRSLEESGDESVLELLGEAARKLVLHRFAQPTDPQCRFNFRKLACEPFCHCRFEPRIGDHSPTHSCRLKNGGQGNESTYLDVDSSDFSAEDLPSCPAGEEPLDVNVRLGLLMKKLLRFLRNNVWHRIKAQVSKLKAQMSKVNARISRIDWML